MKNLPDSNVDYLIIGNSVAAIAAAEAIRNNDRSGSIALVSREPRKAYSRPLISYYLGQRVTLRGMQYRDSLFYREKRIELLGETEVVRVIAKDKCVVCGDGTKIGYGKLLIATGGTPIMPPIKGAKTKGIFNFTILADAEQIKEYVDHERISDAVILGGGLIGLKAAEALMALKKKVTVIELADRILSATFDIKASQIIEKAFAQQGCEIILRDSINEIISRDGKVSEVELVSGRRIEAGLVIVAVGVRPNIALVQDSGIKTNRGIIVDDQMRTSEPDVYAAGDVAEARDFEGDENIVLVIWPDAYRQGKVAGTVMAGKTASYEGGLAMNSVELAGVPTISVGLTDPQEDGFEVRQKGDIKNSIYKKLVFKDDVLVGAILVGKIDRAGIYTGLIKEKISTAAFKDELLSDDFGIISLPREYRKHMVSETDVPIMQS
jgi:NAD(P)H-nitrite reductase large subunit